MKKYIQPSMETIELLSESLMNFVVTSKTADPDSALGNRRRRWSNEFEY